jgi:hypothetical protein
MNEFIIYTYHGIWDCPKHEAQFWDLVNIMLVRAKLTKGLTIMICKITDKDKTQ